MTHTLPTLSGRIERELLEEGFTPGTDGYRRELLERRIEQCQRVRFTSCDVCSYRGFCSLLRDQHLDNKYNAPPVEPPPMPVQSVSPVVARTAPAQATTAHTPKPAPRTQPGQYWPRRSVVDVETNISKK